MASADRFGDTNVIDELICKATQAHAFADAKNEYFSQYSVADIFEVGSTSAVVRSNLRDDELRSAIQV